MIDNKGKGLCVFCGKPATSRDHVPPQGIFPEPKPTDLITVPACDICNSESSMDDEYFRWMVATASGQNETAFRLIKDRIIPRFKDRPALLRKVMQGATKIDIHSEGGIYLGQKPAFHYDRSRVQVVINKIVRGLFYHEFGVRLSSKTLVKEYTLNPKFDDESKQIICSLPLRDIGDGVFSYRFYGGEEELEESFWFLMFFDRTLFTTKTQPNISV